MQATYIAEGMDARMARRRRITETVCDASEHLASYRGTMDFAARTLQVWYRCAMAYKPHQPRLLLDPSRHKEAQALNNRKCTSTEVDTLYTACGGRPDVRSIRR
jgi:hypothetical protein